MRKAINIGSLRALSQIFTPSSFNKVIREEDFSFFDRKISSHYSNHSANNNLQLLQNLYLELENNYRCEYLFKNKLFNKIIKEYSLSTTTVFNEFKVANSKADLMLLNGCVKIFEIKTELDDLTKLKKQINDYQKVADLVSIVTDSKFINKLLLEYKNTNVGIIEFTDRNSLKTHKKALQNSESFEFDTMFKLLHKKEYLYLVKRNFNFIPDVPNTKIFRVCYELLKSIDIIDFQKQILTILKKRTIECPDLLKSKNTPSELKHICYALDFNSNEYEQLFNFLKQKL
jgi:hypothetical protein